MDGPAARDERAAIPAALPGRSGLRPKQLCRVLRFRRACALAGRGLPWGLVAAEAGYFDQAHLIRDFHEFTGDTPMSVFSNTDGGATG